MNAIPRGGEKDACAFSTLGIRPYERGDENGGFACENRENWI